MAHSHFPLFPYLLAPLCSSLAVLAKIKEDIKRSTVAETHGER